MTVAPVHGWMPLSPCGPTCLPRRGRQREVGVARTVLRLMCAAAVLMTGALLVAIQVFVPQRSRRALFRRWFGLLLRAFGVELVLRDGARLDVDGGLLVAANHVSWLDIVALQTVRPMRLLAKTELRAWPLVGAIASRAGTLFIDREGLRTLPGAVSELAAALRGGSMVGVFPEGTTWCGLASGRHRPAVFQAAVEAGALVQPVALRFTVAGQQTTAAAFVGDGTLVTSLLSVARTRDLVVEMSALPPLDARRVRDRRELARLVETAIRDVAGPHLTECDQGERHLVGAA